MYLYFGFQLTFCRIDDCWSLFTHSGELSSAAKADIGEASEKTEAGEAARVGIEEVGVSKVEVDAVEGVGEAAGVEGRRLPGARRR